MATPLQPDPPRHPGPEKFGHSERALPFLSTSPQPDVQLASTALLTPGFRPLPDYKLVHPLGRGGFGEVWKAVGPGGFALALKFIQLGEQAGQIELRALELMKSIRHAHLLPLFGAWQVGGLLVVAMELADGTLLDRLRKVQAEALPGIPREELLEYMREAAKGLDFLNAHRHASDTGPVGVQHKDVKPHNLLLVGGCVKVADFGLAMVLEQTDASASVRMTPAYAAPEFFNGQATRWSDQYCLAVTYCQLRGGRLPFEGTAMQVMAGHLMHAPNLGMLAEEERLAVERALAKDPRERWPTCRALVEALAEAALSRLVVRDSAPEPPLQLLPIEALELGAGQTRSVEVRVARSRCRGPVELRLEGLPEGVRAGPGLIGAERPEGQVVLTADASVQAAIRVIRVVAQTAEEKAEGAFRLIVGLKEERQRAAAVLQERGRGHHTRKDYEQAIADLSEAIELDPEDAKAYVCRGQAYNARGEYDRAIADFGEAIRLAPGEARTYLNRGMAYRSKKDHERAITDYNEAIRLAPRLITAYNGLGLAHNARGEYDQAIAVFGEAIRLAPQDATAYYNRGISYALKTDFDQAIKDYDAALNLKPGFISAYTNRGLAHHARGDYEQAVRDLSEVIRLGPDDPRAYLNRGRTYHLMKEYDRSLADHEAALLLKPGDTRALVNRGWVRSSRKEFAKALLDYNEAIRLAPDSALALNNRAWLLATCPEEQYRDGRAAVVDARRACELTGWKEPSHLDTLAAAHAEAGGFEEAVKWQAQALRFLGISKEIADKFRRRLALYQNRKAYRTE